MGLEEAVVAFFTSEVALPTAPQGLEARQVWWEVRDGWRYPWRIVRYLDGVAQGYPCGEPAQVV